MTRQQQVVVEHEDGARRMVRDVKGISSAWTRHDSEEEETLEPLSETGERVVWKGRGKAVVVVDGGTKLAVVSLA
jgi:hypothetical protein